MITTDIIFDRRHKASGKIPGTIEVKVTVNRRNQYMSTGVRVLKSEWKFGQIVNRPDCVELNERLSAIRQRIEKEVTRAYTDGVEINLQQVKARIVPEREKSEMIEWMLQQTDRMNVVAGTRQHYVRTLEVMQKFGRLNRWTDCTVETIREFDSWLHLQTKPLTHAQQARIKKGAHISPEPLGDAGVYNYHKCLKALLHIAYDVGKIQQNPYDRLRNKFKRGDKSNVEYLTEDEVSRLVNLQIDNRLYDEARDLFVFQCFTGLPYADLMAFNIDDYKQVDGHWINTAERIKTGVPYISQLLPPAVQILEKYDYVLPHINNAEYNERLKVVGNMAEIGTRLHTHLGRHTFATYMLSNGVRIEHVSKMLGHTNIKQTQRYAKVLAEDIRQSFTKIENLINQKKK